MENDKGRAREEDMPGVQPKPHSGSPSDWTVGMGQGWWQEPEK